MQNISDNTGIAISLENVCKTFPTQKPRGTMFNAVKRMFLIGKNHDAQRFTALKSVNIQIDKGDKIGVIGNNGAGKSTLLKLISGIYLPNAGQIYVNGSLNLLTGFGVGMLDELNLIDNLHLYGSIYCMDREEIDKNINEIIEWAGLEDFVSAKLKTLSSGMKTRLAFSAARYFKSDIYVLDEALSAGDKNFRQKCLDYFQNNIHVSKTHIISSHDLGFIEMFCNKTLWLDHGRQMAFGETASVLNEYIDFKH